MARRQGGRQARKSTEYAADMRAEAFDARGAESGAYNLLSRHDLERIHEGVLDILETVGFSEAPDSTRDTLIAAGCRMTEAGRICFPRALVENAIAAANRSLVLHGRDPKHDAELGGSRTYFSTGSASFNVVDPVTRTIRPTTLRDVYDFARLVDRLDNIHVFYRCGLPQDIPDLDDLDVNLCYASLRGTSKHVMSNWFNGRNIDRSLRMLHIIAGSETTWRERPFVSNTCCFSVSPLKFAPESCDGLERSVRGGMPVQLTTAGQMGATSPVTLAGSLVQTFAEVLGGLVYALSVAPDAKVFLGTWPLCSDLRTGAATTGSAEHALLSAASCQLSRFYGIPNGTASGITDSKLPDAQAGYEKGIHHALIGNAGGNLLFSSAGTLASGMGISHAGIVIDNDVIGAVLRTLPGIPVDDDELALGTIKAVCLDGTGHYLGRDETLSRMKSGFYYPQVTDRSSIKEWVQNGTPSILDRAKARSEEILATHHPQHVSVEADAKIRAEFDILLDI